MRVSATKSQHHTNVYIYNIDRTEACYNIR